MKWLIASENKPLDRVDVYVFTENGKRGVARYWSDTGFWLTCDEDLLVSDVVFKWKYANAPKFKG